MASLLALSRALSAEAKAWFRHRLWCHGGTLVATVMALVLDEPWPALLAVAALLTEAAGWFARYRGQAFHAMAEEARRQFMLMDAFGLRTETRQALDLRARVPKAIESRGDALEDPDYFATKRAAGAARLREVLDESAWWSAQLYPIASTRSLLVSGIAVGLPLLVILVLVNLPAGQFVLTLARATVLFLTLLFTVDEIGFALAWRHAGQVSIRTAAQADSLDVNSTPTLIGFFADYSVATASAPPIPNEIYGEHRDRLNQLWSSRGRSWLSEA